MRQTEYNKRLTMNMTKAQYDKLKYFSQMLGVTASNIVRMLLDLDLPDNPLPKELAEREEAQFMLRPENPIRVIIPLFASLFNIQVTEQNKLIYKNEEYTIDPVPEYSLGAKLYMLEQLFDIVLKTGD